ncbi:hypothetical protein EDB80DRAFT_875016 [Ilyonectria destructans]|nr:hypothetical protein EDB80DRAFT_875016 [Ilyonectria destructans]
MDPADLLRQTRAANGSDAMSPEALVALLKAALKVAEEVVPAPGPKPASGPVSEPGSESDSDISLTLHPTIRLRLGLALIMGNRKISSLQLPLETPSKMPIGTALSFPQMTWKRLESA